MRGQNITELGTEQPRFPGSGRQRHSFDAVLRRHYSKTMPRGYRRSRRTRIQLLRPTRALTFVTQFPRFESAARLRRGQRAIKKQLPTAYLTKRSRELTNRRIKVTSAAIAHTTKTRFTSLPLKTLKALRERQVRKFRSKEVTSFSGATEALMQSALKKRFVARRIRDLRKSSKRRQLSRNLSVPF